MKTIIPQEFKEKWTASGDKITRFDSNIIINTKLNNLDKEFLQVGLPEDAAPFLSFGPQSGANLQKVSEVHPNLLVEYDDYLIVGFNGYGDPICIHETKGYIAYLNHDDGFSEIFMNSGLAQFLTFLILFREIMANVNNNKWNTITRRNIET